MFKKQFFFLFNFNVSKCSISVLNVANFKSRNVLYKYRSLVIYNNENALKTYLIGATWIVFFNEGSVSSFCLLTGNLSMLTEFSIDNDSLLTVIIILYSAEDELIEQKKKVKRTISVSAERHNNRFESVQILQY